MCVCVALTVHSAVRHTGVLIGGLSGYYFVYGSSTLCFGASSILKL